MNEQPERKGGTSLMWILLFLILFKLAEIRYELETIERHITAPMEARRE